MKKLALLALFAMSPAAAFTFEALEGGRIDLDDWRGQPVLVVNTASLCGFTHQYGELQTLYDRYRAKGLVVLGVPSNDFRQELGSAEEVAEFCDMNYGLDLPLTDITPVRGAQAHPFYRWLATEEGFTPRWNFNKVLLDGEGAVVAHWGAATSPVSADITVSIEKLLTR